MKWEENSMQEACVPNVNMWVEFYTACPDFIRCVMIASREMNT